MATPPVAGELPGFPQNRPKPALQAVGLTSRLDVSPVLLRRQVTLVGSWTFSKQGQPECAEFIADHSGPNRRRAHPVKYAPAN